MRSTENSTESQLITHIQSLLAELPNGESPNVAVYRCVRKQVLRNMLMPEPTLVLPLLGKKVVHVGNTRIDGCVGDLLILPDNVDFHVSNLPDLDKQSYTGLVIRFDTNAIELFKQIYSDNFSSWDLTPGWKYKASLNHYRAVSDYLTLLASTPANTTQLRHRLCEILLLLAENGMLGSILTGRQKSFSKELHKLLSVEPAKDWRVDEICELMSVSESTLRRKLKAEGHSFRSVLEDVRLLRGIFLVMETAMPTISIAYECGYQSQSRFTERFRKRFTMSPSELRATAYQQGEVVNINQATKTSRKSN